MRSRSLGDGADRKGRRQRTKLAVLLVSGIASGAIGWQIWGRFGPSAPAGGAVELIDQTDEIAALLAKRRANGPRERPQRPTTFLREPLDLETAQRFFPALIRRPWFFAEHGYYRPNRAFSRMRHWGEHPDQGWSYDVNSRGMREAEEPTEGDLELRVLVTGDSHTEGVCATDETFPNVLESLLIERRGDAGIEVLNAGFNGYNLYNYVGTLEAFLDLEPDLFIVCAYGGNDFYGMMGLQRYFSRREAPRKSGGKLSAFVEIPDGLAAQEFLQARYFLDNPEDVRIAVWTLELGTLELQRICQRHGIELMIVYLPPPTRGQPDLDGHWVDELFDVTGVDAQAAAVSDRIADRWLAFLDEHAIHSLDLRPLFRAHEEPLYWQRDHHINVRAHRLIAEALVPIVEAQMATER